MNQAQPKTRHCLPVPTALACPGIRQIALILALIKPIGLCGTQNAQKIFWTRPTIFRPPYHFLHIVNRPSELQRSRGVGSEKFFVCFGYNRAQLV